MCLEAYSGVVKVKYENIKISKLKPTDYNPHKKNNMSKIQSINQTIR